MAWGDFYSNGEIIAAAPSGHQYEISIDPADVSANKPGTTFMRNWGVDRSYEVKIFCHSKIKGTRRYSATTTMKSSSTPGYLVLNDYIDVKVELSMISGPGGASDFVSVPFRNRSNNITDTCTPPFEYERNTRSGAIGKITFLIKKPLVNGVDLQGSEIVRLYGNLGSFPNENNPMSVITITSGIIVVPDKCVINEGEVIAVEFDDIPGRGDLINSRNYSKKIPITVKCQGGSFDTGNVNVKLGIQPSGSGLANFNPDYLGTTRNNLGVSLKDKSGNIIVPNHFYFIDHFDNNQGRWELTASPVAKPGSEITEGEYESTASIVAEFQ